MCITMLGQAVYMAIMFVGLVLTLVSMFTPAWRSFTAKSPEYENQLKHLEFGFFQFLCSDDMFPRTTTAPGGSGGVGYSCKDFWKNQPTWEKVVIVCLALAVVAQLVALVWTGMTFCACCCKKYLVHPLPLLAILAAVFLGVAVIVFAIENKDSIDRLSYVNKPDSEAIVSWSFYLACGAIVCMVANIILGFLVVKIAKTPF